MGALVILQGKAAGARLRACAALFFASLLGSPGAAYGADVALSTPGPTDYSLHVTSFAEIPFRTVIKQRYDYSCGSAALATLLRFHYARDTDESEIFKSMFAAGDQDRIKKLGFSLLDMKSYLASLGYQADGFRIPLNDMKDLAIPAIALIQVGSYKHFVVIKGEFQGHVLVGDPALGLREYTNEDFQKIWNGIAFLIREVPKGDKPAVFNSAVEWQRWSDAHPLMAANVNFPLEPFQRDLRVIYEIEPNQVLTSPFQP